MKLLTMIVVVTSDHLLFPFMLMQDCITILWQDTWSPGPFTFTVEESAPPTAPQNLMAMGGVEAAYLDMGSND